jgi:hypothetical protein
MTFLHPFPLRAGECATRWDAPCREAIRLMASGYAIDGQSGRRSTSGYAIDGQSGRTSTPGYAIDGQSGRQTCIPLPIYESFKIRLW